MHALFVWLIAIMMSSFSFSASAGPKVAPPFTDPHYIIMPIMMGELVDWSQQIVRIGNTGNSAEATLSVCILDHKLGEPLYMIVRPEGGVFIVQKEVMDKAFQASGYKFDRAIRAVVAKRKMCAVTGIKATK